MKPQGQVNGATVRRSQRRIPARAAAPVQAPAPKPAPVNAVVNAVVNAAVNAAAPRRAQPHLVPRQFSASSASSNTSRGEATTRFERSLNSRTREENDKEEEDFMREMERREVGHYTAADDILIRDLFSQMWCGKNEKAWSELENLSIDGSHLARAAVAVCYGCPDIDVIMTDAAKYKLEAGQCISWLQDNSARGSKSAQFFLGAFYENGIMVTRDYDRAFELYRSSAEQGYSPAQYSLGVGYEIEQGIVGNQHEAIHWYRRAAEQGYVHARANIGACYERGIGVDEDYQEAMKFYREAADAFDLSAIWSIGRLYERGYGVRADIRTAKEWYDAAADLGSVDAVVVLAKRLVCSENFHDQMAGTGYYRRATKLRDMEALRDMGSMYKYGLNTMAEPHWLAARQCFTSAASLGDPVAQNELGIMHFEQKGGLIMARGVDYFRRAAEQQCAEAQCNLAYCYASGFCIDKDPAEAARWYQRAAYRGNAEGMASLGYCYAKGFGVAADRTKAVSLLQSAAACNHSDAKRYIREISGSNTDLFIKPPKKRVSLGRRFTDGDNDSVDAYSSSSDSEIDWDSDRPKFSKLFIHCARLCVSNCTDVTFITHPRLRCPGIFESSTAFR
jgi:TPR repeat protein